MALNINLNMLIRGVMVVIIELIRNSIKVVIYLETLSCFSPGFTEYRLANSIVILVRGSSSLKGLTTFAKMNIDSHTNGWIDY